MPHHSTAFLLFGKHCYSTVTQIAFITNRMGYHIGPEIVVVGGAAPAAVSSSRSS